MKKLLFIVLSIVLTQSKANMASPIVEGTYGTRPFINQNVAVVHEDLFIIIDKGFQTASFNIKYHIDALKDGIQIPFLFYASEYLDSFVVKVDGQVIPVQNIPYDENYLINTKFKDFSYFFEEKKNENERSEVLLEEDNKSGFYISLSNMLFFETDIAKGNHIIEVSYRGTVWLDQWDWINKYSFRYALSPAKYWKSFGTLSIQVDASAFEGNLTTNIGTAQKGSINKIAQWNFDHLPTEVLMIEFEPEISPIAHFFIQLSPLGLALISIALIIIMHYYLLKYYRQKFLSKKYSIVVIMGSIIVPLIFVISWMFNYHLIDLIIGPNASKRHGYTFFVLFLYPFIMPIYWLVIWLIDKNIKTYYLDKKLN